MDKRVDPAKCNFCAKPAMYKSDDGKGACRYHMAALGSKPPTGYLASVCHACSSKALYWIKNSPRGYCEAHRAIQKDAGDYVEYVTRSVELRTEGRM